jgi:hypothetical protein
VQAVPVGESRARLISGDIFATLTSNGTVLEATGLPNDPSLARAYAPHTDSIDQWSRRYFQHA